MAVVYSVQDIEAYKAAMARHAAKNNRLIEKWSKYRDEMVAELEKLSEQTPGPARDSYQLVLENARDTAESILKDLELPADAEISDFDWRNCK